MGSHSRYELGELRVKPLDKQYQKVVLNLNYVIELLMKLVELLEIHSRHRLINKIVSTTTVNQQNGIYIRHVG